MAVAKAKKECRVTKAHSLDNIEDLKVVMRVLTHAPKLLGVNTSPFGQKEKSVSCTKKQDLVHLTEKHLEFVEKVLKLFLEKNPFL